MAHERDWESEDERERGGGEREIAGMREKWGELGTSRKGAIRRERGRGRDDQQKAM